MHYVFTYVLYTQVHIYMLYIYIHNSYEYIYITTTGATILSAEIMYALLPLPCSIGQKQVTSCAYSQRAGIMRDSRRWAHGD